MSDDFRKYVFVIKIVVKKRPSDWIAYVSGADYVWEAGASAEEARGKLVAALDTRLGFPLPSLDTI